MDLKCSNSLILCQVPLRAASECTSYWEEHVYMALELKPNQQNQNQETNQHKKPQLKYQNCSKQNKKIP